MREMERLRDGKCVFGMGGGGWRKGEGKETDGDRKERVRQVYVMYVKIKNIVREQL